MSDATLMAGCLPEMLTQYAKLKTAAAGKKIVIKVHDDGYAGFRTAETQAKLRGWQQDSAKAGEHYAAAPAGKSYHEAGAAVDVRIVTHSEKSLDAAYRALADLGRGIGLTAGYYFKSVPSDPYHFELAGALDVLRQRLAAMGGGTAPRGSLPHCPSCSCSNAVAGLAK